MEDLDSENGKIEITVRLSNSPASRGRNLHLERFPWVFVSLHHVRGRIAILDDLGSENDKMMIRRVSVPLQRHK